MRLVIAIIASVTPLLVALIGLMVAALIPVVNLLKGPRITTVVREQIATEHKTCGKEKTLPPRNSSTAEKPIVVVATFARNDLSNGRGS